MIAEIVLVFLIIILLLVVSHELGHFLTAKWFGVRVDEFGIGIPPRIGGVTFGETLYSLNLLPFGGFVRIYGEEADVNDPRSFSAQSFFRKSFIVGAGVIANIAVAYIIFSFLAWMGSPGVGIIIEGVAPNSPAAAAGIEKGDIIAGIGPEGQEPARIEDVEAYIQQEKGKGASLRIKRGDTFLIIQATPRVSPPEGEGALGIVMTESGLRGVRWYRAPWEGLKLTVSSFWVLLGSVFYFFSVLFSSGQAPGDIVGPVGIAVLARETFNFGLFSFFELLALLSLNLAIINILPIPALDGGRILFFIIEKITGRPIPARVAGVVHSIFFILLILFLIWVTHRDIVNWDRYLTAFSEVTLQ